MKKGTVVNLILIISHSLSAQIKMPLSEEKFNGKIKSVEMRVFSAVKHFGEMKTDTTKDIDIVFAELKENNQPIKVRKTSSSRKGLNLVEFYYDTLNRLTKVIDIESDNNSDITTFKYDQKNNIIESVILKNNSIYEKKTSKYDGRGSILEYIVYGSDGNIEEKVSWEYNLDGSLYKKHISNKDEHEEIIYNHNLIIETNKTELTGKKISGYYKYNTNKEFKSLTMGHWESDTFQEDYKYVFTYDPKTKSEKQSRYEKYGGTYHLRWVKSTTITNHLNKRKTIRYTTQYPDGNGRQDYEEFEYDENENLIREEHKYSFSKQIDVTKYIYDSKGNWFRKIRTKKNQFTQLDEDEVYIYERIFTYR
jgi:hypothetical protein